MDTKYFCDIDNPYFWLWDWGHNPCIRRVFVDAVWPTFLAAIAWLLFSSCLGPSALPTLRRSRVSGRDNRVWIGPAVVILVFLQAAVQAVAVYSQKLASSSSWPVLVSGSFLLTIHAIVIWVTIRQWQQYTRHGGNAYFGLFSPPIIAFTGGCITAGMAEFYAMFLVQSQWATPIWGGGAPKEAPALLAKLSISSATAVLLLVVRKLPSSASAISLPETPDETAPQTPTSAIRNQQHKPQRVLSKTTLFQQQSPELGSSILDSAMFNWINPFIQLSQLRQPELDDLFAPPKKYTMSASWQRFCSARRQGSSLGMNLARTFWPEILTQLLLNPILALLEYMQPILMQRLLEFVNDYSKTQHGLRYGFFLATAMLLINLVSAQVEQQQAWHARSLCMFIRNILVTLLTRKTLSRRSKNSSEASDWGIAPGGEDQSDGRTYNILTADVGRMTKILMLIDIVALVPWQQCIGAWYMYKLLGSAGVAGTLMLILGMFLMRRLISQANRMESELGSLNDQRLAIISEVVQGITSIKLFGWGSRFIEIIGNKRAEHLALLWSRAKTWCWINLCTMGSLPFINFTAFMLYSLDHDLDAATIFTAIAVFMIIQRSVNALPAQVADTISMLVSFQRISAYLDQTEVQPLGERIEDSCDSNNVVGFKDATLSWGSTSSSREFFLKSLNVQFPIGKLSLIGGATGSGKSSMLSALIGEMTVISGKILVPTDSTSASADFGTFAGLGLASIAYVAQDPWLCNATIRENILFGEPYVQSRYEQVLQVCALFTDLLILSAGDMSEIGERGITLSGGQKQRVALARAMYSSSNVLLIDDCLSAVDVHTGKHILNQCLLSTTGLMDGRTCVLVTHHMAMCLPYCDFVVMLRDGGVEYQGPPQGLGDFTGQLDCLLSELDVDIGGTNSPSRSSQSNVLSPDDGSALSKAVLDSEDNIVTETQTPQTLLSTSSVLNGKLVKDEVRIQGLVKMETWKTYFDPCGGWAFVAVCIISILGAQLLIVYKDYFLATRIDAAESSPTYLLGMYLLIGFLAALSSTLTLLWMYLRSLQASMTLHKLLLSSIVYATPRFLETTPIGRIMTRFTKDMQIIDEDIIEILNYFLRFLVSMLLTLVVISMSVPPFIFVGVAIMAVYTRLSWQFMQGQRECKRLEAISYAPMLSLYSEIIPGCETIRGFGMQQAYMVEMERRFTEFLSSDMLLRVVQRWLGIRMGVASSLVSFFTSVFILLSIDQFSSGLTGFTLIYAVRFWTESASVVRKYSSLELSVNCVERVHQYMSIEREAAPKTVSELHRRLLSEGWPRTGDLVVSDLVVGYTVDRAVLHGITFHAQHGEKIGIVGRTGAGKSTMSLALLRFVETTLGTIKLDGVDISQLGLEDLRQKVTIIPQDPVLFNGTIRFNLDPFGDHADSELMDALRCMLLLRPASTAAFDSLDDYISSNGQSLSLGQRQLVALTRALVRRSRLVIIDEATASVDFATDNYIQRIIRSSTFAESTLLCIAHRLRTIIDYDRILVMDAGKVVEFDTPQNLLQMENGVFRGMCVDSGELAHLEAVANGRV